MNLNRPCKREPKSFDCDAFRSFTRRLIKVNDLWQSTFVKLFKQATLGNSWVYAKRKILLHMHMGAGRGAGGDKAPQDLEIWYLVFNVSVKKSFSHSFGVDKMKFYHCCSPLKISFGNLWKNPLLLAPWKISFRRKCICCYYRVRTVLHLSCFICDLKHQCLCFGSKQVKLNFIW